MTQTEFVEVSYKRYRSDNPDGTGKILVLENKSARANFSDSTLKAQTIRETYRIVKKSIN